MGGNAFRVPLHTLFPLIFGLTIAVALVVDDPDFFFHLKAGEDLWQGRVLPEVDHYSFTHDGQPWRAHEWLFALIIYPLFSMAGFAGIKIFVAVMGSAALFISGRALSARHNSELPLVIFCGVLLIPFLTPRPHLFTLLFFAIFLFALLRFKYRSEIRYLWGLPIVMVAWVNLHGAFLLGIVLISTYIAGELLMALWRQQLVVAVGKLRPVLLVWLATCAASLLNPWGPQHWLFPFELMGSSAIAMISEWQPLTFSDTHERLYMVWLGGALLLYLHGASRPDLTEVALPWGVVVASLFAVRHMALALLALVPFMVLMQQRVSAGTGWLQHPRVMALRQRLRGRRELGHRSESLLNIGLLCVTMVVFAALYSHFQRNEAERRNARLPVGAADFIIQTGLQGRMFNTYHYGGYLIYRLAPQRQVFIDIRGDMFGAQVMGDYRTLYNALPGWQALLQRYGIDYLVIEREAPLAAATLSSGSFAIAYQDRTSMVLVRSEQRHRQTIEQWHATEAEADWVK